MYKFIKSLLATILPNGGTVCVIQAYFDESGTHANSPVMCVAGYLIDSAQCTKFQQDWDEILKRHNVERFHMSECAHGTGKFSHLGKSERAEICKRLIGLIKLRCQVGIVVSVSEKDFWSVMPEGFRFDPYSFCAHFCLQGVIAWAHKYGHTEDIAYFFETGHPSRNAVDTLIDWLIQRGDIAKGLCYGSHTFVLNKKLCGFAAADLLSWEWNRDYINKHGERRRPRRLSLDSLMEKTHIGIHMTVEHLQAYLESARQAESNGLVEIPEILRTFHELAGFSTIPKIVQ